VDGPLTRATPLAASVYGLAGGLLALHVATSARYGYFGDELYFLACARRLAWSYVDLGPASIALLRAWTAIAGSSLTAIRIVPALAAALTVLVTALLARRLGGGPVAQTIAALAMVIAPGLLVVGHYYSMNALDPALWALAALAFLHTRDDGLVPWIALGVVLGVGMLNKLSVAWLGAGLALGFVLTCPRVFAEAGPWVAAAITGVAVVPIVGWQMAHGWPTVEFVRNVLDHKLAPVPLVSFVRNQVLLIHPLVFPIAAIGLVRLLSGAGAALAVAYLATAALLYGIGASKAYYMLGAYPPLVAAGAVVVEQAARRRPWIPGALATVLVVGGLASLPLALPVLPVERLIAYQQALGFTPPTEDKRVTGALPGHFANMHGWPEIVADVKAASASLATPGRAIVLADDYMEASALEQLGRAAGLPPIAGTHDSWAMWPPATDAPAEVVLVGRIADQASAWFDDVRVVGRIDCTHCLPWRVGRPIAIARGLRVPFATVLAQNRHFD
jgi:hypothetical protein